MATGESFSLAIPVLANIYDGLIVVSDLASIEDRDVVLPYHYVYGWLGEYFGTHFSLSTLDKSGPSVVKLGPLMTKYSGVFSAKSLYDQQAQALFRSCEGLKMDRVARFGTVRRDIIDDSHIHFSDLSYLISLRSGYVSLRQEDRCIIQPYSPHRFSRQFGFVQNVPGTLREKARSKSLQAVYMHWESCTRACTNASITLPTKDEFKSNPVTRVYVRWWSKVYYENLGTASGTNSSHSHHDALKEGCSVVPTQLVPFDCASVTPLRDRPVALAPQRPCLSPRHSDASEEAGDEGDSHEDGFTLQQRQQVSDKRPLEDAQADSDVNFRHKKKEVFRPSQFNDRAPFEGDVRPSRHFNLATADVYSYTEMLFVDGLPTDREIGDLPGVELVPNPPNFPSLPCVCGDLTLLNEDLSKFVSVIDNLNIDSSSLKIKIAELMAVSTEYSSLRAISLEKLSPDGRLDALVREREQLVIEASQLKSVLAEQETVLSQYQEEISRLEREKGMAMELPILSPTEVETLKTLEGSLEERLRSFKDIVFK
ncbi:unnamed protein product [Malus baccata var. baccata]